MPVRVPANSSPGGMRSNRPAARSALAPQEAAEHPADDVRDERPEHQPDHLAGRGVRGVPDLVAGEGADQDQDQAEDLDEEHSASTLLCAGPAEPGHRPRPGAATRPTR